MSDLELKAVERRIEQLKKQQLAATDARIRQLKAQKQQEMQKRGYRPSTPTTIGPAPATPEPNLLQKIMGGIGQGMGYAQGAVNVLPFHAFAMNRSPSYYASPQDKANVERIAKLNVFQQAGELAGQRPSRYLGQPYAQQIEEQSAQKRLSPIGRSLGTAASMGYGMATDPLTYVAGAGIAGKLPRVASRAVTEAFTAQMEVAAAQKAADAFKHPTPENITEGLLTAAMARGAREHANTLAKEGRIAARGKRLYAGMRGKAPAKPVEAPPKEKPTPEPPKAKPTAQVNVEPKPSVTKEMIEAARRRSAAEQRAAMEAPRSGPIKTEEKPQEAQPKAKPATPIKPPAPPKKTTPSAPEPKGESNATKEIVQQAGREPEHPRDDTQRPPTESGGRSGPVEPAKGVPGTEGAKKPAEKAVETPEPLGDFTGVRNKIVEPERAERNLSPVERQHYTLAGPAFLLGKQIHETNPTYHEDLAAEVAAKPRVLSVEEVGSLAYGRHLLKEEYEAAGKGVDEAIKGGNAAQIASAQARLRDIEERFDRNDQALVKGGREQSAAFNARKIVVTDEGNYLDVQALAKRKKGADLTPVEQNRFKALADEVKAKNAEIARLEEELSKKEATTAVDRVSKMAQRRGRTANTLEAIRKERTVLIKDLKKALGQQSLNVGPKQAADATLILGKLAINYIKEGATKLDDVVTKIQEDFPDLLPRQIHDALSGYGRKQVRVQTEVQKRIAQLKNEARLLSATEDMPTPGEAKTLRNPRAKTKEEVALQAELDAYRRQETVRKAIAEAEAKLQKPTPERLTKKGLPKSEEETHLAQLRKEYQARQADIERMEATRKKAELEESGVETRKPKVKRDKTQEEEDLLKKINLHRRMRDIQGEIDDLNEQLRTKQFKRPIKVERAETDPHLQALTQQRAFAKAKVRDALHALEPKTGLQRAVEIGRAMKLAGLSVFTKLAGASATAMPIETLANAISVPFGKLPVKVEGKWMPLSAIAEREGQFSFKTEAKGYRAVVSREAVRNAIQTFRQGYNAIDAEAGALGHTSDFSSWPGRLHGAEKSFLQTGEYHRAFEYRMNRMAEQAKREGKPFDPNDPDVVTKVGYGAAMDAQTIKLQGPNKAAQGLNNAIRALERTGGEKGNLGTKVAAAFLQTLVPITRVPANYLGKTIRMTGGGLIEGSVRYAEALRSKDAVTPEQADQIIRAYKYGGLGAVAAGIAIMAPSWFKVGGYLPARRGGTQAIVGSDGKDLAPGEMEVFGVRVPRLLQHNPFFEAIQFWATMKRGADQEQMAQGAYETGTGLAKEAPGLESVSQAGQSLVGQGFDPAGFWGDYVRGMTEPQFLYELSKFYDRDQPFSIWPQGQQVQRKSKGFLENIQKGIPGLRQQLPERSP